MLWGGGRGNEPRRPPAFYTGNRWSASEVPPRPFRGFDVSVDSLEKQTSGAYPGYVAKTATEPVGVRSVLPNCELSYETFRESDNLNSVRPQGGREG